MIKTELSLTSTDELMKELQSRYDHTVMSFYSCRTDKGHDFQWSYSGSILVALGMLERTKNDALLLSDKE